MTTTTDAVDTWDMLMVHRVFRREFRMMPALIRAVPDRDTARAETVGFHLAAVADGLHHHHSGEDELLWPLLLERAAPHAGLVRRMEAQHDRLHEPIDRIGRLNPVWRAQARATERDQLAEVVAQASAALDEHLADEEQEILPLVAEHLSTAEWAALGERGRATMPKGKLGLVFLGSLLEEATPVERARFLADLPAPARLLWRMVGVRVYGTYRDRVRNG